MASRKLIVEIVGDSKSLERSFAQSTTASKKFAVGLGTVAKTALAFGGVVGAINLVSDALHSGIEEFSQSQKIAAQTNAAIKSTGAVANVTASHINALSLALSNLSGVDDEVVKAGENVLLSFTAIRNQAGKNNDIFDQATRAAVNFAVRTGRDVPTAALVLGKALQDPVKRLAGLARAGIVFTDSQTKLIKKLQESGKLLGAQKILLGEIEKRFGGAAQAAGRTLPGKLNILRERFQDVAGALVQAFTPALNRGATALTKFLTDSRNQARIQEDVAKTARAVASVTKAFADVLVTLRNALEPVVKAMGGLGNAAKLLVAVLVARKITAFIAPIRLLGVTAETSAARVNLLRGALLRLGALGLITVGIEVLLNKDEIDKKVNSFLQRNHAGFLTAQAKKIPIGVDVTDLDRARQALINMGQAGDLGERSLKLVADRLREVGTAASEGLAAASKVEAGRAASQSQSGQGIIGAINNALGITKAAVAAAISAAKKQKALAEKAAKAAKAAAEKQRKAFDSLIDSLGLKVDMAAATRGFADDLAANAAVQAAIRKQIAIEGNTTELATQLFQAQQARAQILADQAQAASDQRAKLAAKIQATQFKALGLSGTGDQRTPGVANLRKQLSQLTDRLGSDVAPKVAAQLAGVGKVLSGALGKVTLETRQKIVELFQTIRSTFQDQSKGPLTKTTSLNTNKILAGLGLTPDLMRELRSRLSSFNSAGMALAGAPTGSVGAFGMLVPAQPTTVNTTVELDGRVVARNTTKHQQVRSRRNPPQKRGPHGI